MKAILSISIVLLTLFLGAPQALGNQHALADQPACINTSTVELALDGQDLSESINFHVKSFLNPISKGVMKSKLPNLEFFANPQCKEHRDGQGFQDGCLYIPNLVYQLQDPEAIDISLEELSSLKFYSKRTALQLFAMKIVDFKIRNIHSDCVKAENSLACQVQADISDLTFETHLRLSDIVTDKRVLGTVSPVRVVVKATPEQVAQITFPLQIQMGVLSQDSIEIISDKLKLDIPAKTIQEIYDNNMDEVQSVLEYEAQRAKEFHQINSGNRDEYVKDITYDIVYTYVINDYLMQFLKYKNYIQTYKSELLDLIRVKVGDSIGEVIKGQLRNQEQLINSSGNCVQFKLI